MEPVRRMVSTCSPSSLSVPDRYHRRALVFCSSQRFCSSLAEKRAEPTRHLSPVRSTVLILVGTLDIHGNTSGVSGVRSAEAWVSALLCQAGVNNGAELHSLPHFERPWSCAARPITCSIRLMTVRGRNLTAWAENGVLMLNTCLTVRAGSPGSHSNQGWERFTDKVVDVVDRYGGANLPSVKANDKTGHGRGVVFLAWGAWAAKRVAKLSKVRLRQVVDRSIGY